MDSILTSTKKLLGIAEEYEHFDIDIIMHVNSVLALVTQLGIGPETGFAITGKEETWADFMPGNDPRLGFVKSYVYLKTRLLFDPPASAAALESARNLASELEWRLQVAANPAGNRES